MANNNIKKANTNLDKALEHQKEARYKFSLFKIGNTDVALLYV